MRQYLIFNALIIIEKITSLESKISKLELTNSQLLNQLSMYYLH